MASWTNTPWSKIQQQQQAQQMGPMGNPWNTFVSQPGAYAFGDAMRTMGGMAAANAQAGSQLGQSQNQLAGNIYGYNTEANMNLTDNRFNRRNTLDTLASLLERAKLTSGDTRYTADRSLDEAKEASGANRFGSLADLLGVRYKSDTDRGIASEAQQFGRSNLLDQLGLQRYLGDIGANTDRYGFDTSMNVEQERAGAEKFGSLADALLGRYRADTDLSGLKYMSDAELKGLGIQGDTARDVAEIQSQTSLLPALLGLGFQRQKFSSIFPLIQGLIPQLGSMANMGMPPQFSAN